MGVYLGSGAGLSVVEVEVRSRDSDLYLAFAREVNVVVNHCPLPWRRRSSLRAENRFRQREVAEIREREDVVAEHLLPLAQGWPRRGKKPFTDGIFECEPTQIRGEGSEDVSGRAYDGVGGGRRLGRWAVSEVREGDLE